MKSPPKMVEIFLIAGNIARLRLISQVAVEIMWPKTEGLCSGLINNIYLSLTYFHFHIGFWKDILIYLINQILIH